MKKLFLLDAYALIFRAYFALSKVPRLTRDGRNTSAIYGFVNTLEEVLRKERPTHIAVCFDPPGPTFRNEAYTEYKAERAATPEDIKISIPIIKEIIRAYNIPIVEVAGYEADDVIGTLATRAAGEGFTTYMMTPDKDYGQLVGPHTIQYKPSYRGQDFELRGEEEICERYGLKRTEQMIDLLALMGDKIDNIPGCPGVGEVTAKKLIAEYDNVENLIAHADTLKGALRRKVEDNAEQIKFSKYLATICTNVPVEEDPENLVVKEPDREKLFAIFDSLEFRTLRERVERRLKSENTKTTSPNSKISNEAKKSTAGDSEKPKEDNLGGLFGWAETDNHQSTNEISAPSLSTDIDIKEVKDITALNEMRRSLDGVTQIGISLHSVGENDAMSVWRESAIALPDGKVYLIPADYEEGNALVLDLMALPTVQKISLNAKRDMVVAARHRLTRIPDTMTNYYDITLAHYVIAPETRHSIDNLADIYLNVTPETIDDPRQELCRNTMLTLRLYTPLHKEVREAGMQTLLEEVELPLARVLADMELTGVRLDSDMLREASVKMEERIERLQTEIYQLAGCEFNVGSPAKVGEILFDTLKLDPKAKKTKTGQYSTSEEILEKLTSRHPIVEKILKYRALRKLVSTYLLALPAAADPTTGKIHTNYNQTVTATGRISSSAPNLQNIPVRDEEGRDIRRAFTADEGDLFLSADYSQIELRLMADFSGDQIMLDAFRHGRDIHAITASKIFHKEVDEVSDTERRKAKTANFGIIYGISAFGLAQRLNIPRGEAKEIIDNYFLTFPTIKKYITDSVEKAREQGYVETRMGRRRMLPDINSRNPTVRGFAERNAINAPLQGTAADVIKVAMIRIYEEMQARGLKSRMIMQIHDELNFNVVPDELPVMQELVERQMRDAYRGDVTLTASAGVGANWLEAH